MAHVVEAGIAIRSGTLRPYGPENTNLNEVSVAVPIGPYSTVVGGRGFDTTNDYGDERADEYALHFWPGPLIQPRVLKAGFTWVD